jgi:hypothetical protein
LKAILVRERQGGANFPGSRAPDILRSQENLLEGWEKTEKEG